MEYRDEEIKEALHKMIDTLKGDHLCTMLFLMSKQYIAYVAEDWKEMIRDE